MQKQSDISLYKALPHQPYHLSVGVLTLDKDSQIICLHYPRIDELTDMYVLPNKTVKSNETLENAAKRGAKAELGADIKILRFLGVMVTDDRWWAETGTSAPIQKAVAFFLAQEESSPYLDEATSENENEKREIVHVPFNFLLETLKTQKTKEGIKDFNHYEIVRRAKAYLDRLTD